jgi:hypothetical protein
MNYIEYLDLPNIPEHLIDSIQDIIDKPMLTSGFRYFKNKPVSNELKMWLQSVFDFEIHPSYQFIYDGLPIHIDRGNRISAYNYLLDTGGDNVITTVYNQERIPLQSEKIELKRWHRINTGMLHGVYGINPDKIRISLSIGVYS